MSHDTWIHRVARVTVVRPLAKTGIAPNHVTTARLILGIGGAALVAVGGGLWPYIGAAVFVVSMVLDRADGDLARLTGRTSARGHVYDLLADTLSNAALFLALGIGESGGLFGPWALVLGLAAAGAVAATFGMVMAVEGEGGERAGELPSAAGFDADDAMLLVPLGIWLGWPDAVLLAAAIGAPLFALSFVVRFRQLFSRLAFQRGAQPGRRHTT
ncbi:MAG: CDP-alcohol phosphatidyltransferase family protein [Rhodospirillales bacterium]|nr:CDP-alcohol phosphatidyltransferase family protein [Rhodospirillales bacterium]